MNGVPLHQAGLFVGSLVLMSVSSFVLTVALEKVGVGLHLSEGLLGILTALGADAQEALLCWREGLRRGEGMVLVALYLLFAGTIIFWPTIAGHF